MTHMLQRIRQHPHFMYLILVTLLISAPLPVAAQDKALAYLSESQLPPTFLMAPPREGTRAEDAQLAMVRATQKNVSDVDLAAMRDEQHVHLGMVTSALGPTFTRDNLPLTFALLDRVMHDTGIIVEDDKQYWHTRRPYLVDDHVMLLVDPIDQSPSYPSGHTCASRVLAEVLAMLVPSHRAALVARADSIAQHRVMAGVHYPVDLAGGRRLAQAIVQALNANNDFQRDLAAARDELNARPPM